MVNRLTDMCMIVFIYVFIVYYSRICKSTGLPINIFKTLIKMKEWTIYVGKN